ERALRLLADHKLVVEGPPGHESDPAAAAASFVAGATRTSSPSSLAEALRRARVGVLGSGALAADVARSLRAGGIAHVGPGARRKRLDLVVAAPSPGETGLLAMRWLAVRDPHLPGALFALEPAEGLSLRRHPVHRVPRCPACSPAAVGGRPLPWFPEVGLAHG